MTSNNETMPDEMQYQGIEYDDWGCIRCSDNKFPVLKINPHFFSDDLDNNRRDKTDPCEEFGKALVKAWNTRADRQAPQVDVDNSGRSVLKKKDGK